MKKLVIVALMLSGTFAFAQKDKVVTSEVSKTTVVENGEVVNKKVKVVTEKSQDVKFDESQKYQLNQNRVPSAVAVTKIYMIDNDNDPEYDEVTKVKYYYMNDKKYGFKVDNEDLAMSYMDGEKEVSIGKAMKSKYNDYYIIRTDDMNGIGYFTEDNNFMMEYYDEKTGTMKTVELQNLKF